MAKHDKKLVLFWPRFPKPRSVFGEWWGLVRLTVINQVTHSIDAAMKYYDKIQFGRDRTPGDPQRFHNVNSLVWRCGAAPRLEAPSGCFAGGYGVRALPVLTAHDISLPEQ